MPTVLLEPIGPILYLDDFSAGHLHLAALIIMKTGDKPGLFTVGDLPCEPLCLINLHGISVWRIRFSLPADQNSSYRYQDQFFPVASNWRADLRIAYCSCNGEETGDLERSDAERNVMWARLRRDCQERAYSLLLHGGDQLYADEVVKGHELSEGWPKELPEDPDDMGLATLREHLSKRFLERYLALYKAPHFAWLVARVPSLMQWDDHDICDGWGSLPRSRTCSPVGQTLFEVARQYFLLFQHATLNEDLPARFHDRSGAHLGWCVDFPKLRIIAPDLRSERTRRAIMGKGGWQMMEAEAKRQSADPVFLLSSVPLLGPRLSILELFLMLSPRMQKYEDDLRDQWQSRAHRHEWRQLLKLLQAMIERTGTPLTVISGEIHLAARAELGSDTIIHQLVASGISHRAPPKLWALFLHFFAFLGEDPLKGQQIRIERIPGKRWRYIAERNYLILRRSSDVWTAQWRFEAMELTDPIIIAKTN